MKNMSIHKCPDTSTCQYHKAIYLSMQDKNNDLANIVDAAYAYLKVHNHFPVKGNEKSESASLNFREKGDQSLDKNEYLIALKHYNAALVTAPPNSDTMRQAYNRRSYLYYVYGLYEESLKDMKTLCTTVGCSLKMYKKDLFLRIKTCKTEIAKRPKTKESQSLEDDEFFSIKDLHPDIPCASTSVAISDEYRVIAAKDISIGTVVAVEKAFIAHCERKNWLLTCHNCKKLELNLHPCPHCPFVLFCNDECRAMSEKEYHATECPIMCLMLHGQEISGIYNVVTESIIKIKGGCSWSEFISASRNMGSKRMKKKTTREIFDLNSKFSMFCYDDDKVVSYSKVYNHAFACAKILHFLCVSVPQFFPKEPNVRNEAIRAVGRSIMGMCMYVPLIRLDQKTYPVYQSKLETYDYVTMAMFAFTSKLRNECDPNLLVVGLNNTAALVAIKPIKAGTELTISYLTHWADSIRIHRGPRLFYFTGVFCKCRVCRADWNADADSQVKTMDRNQAQCVRKFKSTDYYKLNTPIDKRGLKQIFQALQILGEIPYCSEYLEVLDLFKAYMQERMQAITQNMILKYP